MPDTWVTPRVWVAGERVSASKMNEISTDLRVLFPVTAAGDVVYANAANTLAAVAKPSVASYLRNSSAGVAFWSRDIASMIGGLQDFSMVESTTEFITTSTTGADITGMSTTLTLTHFCDILLIASGSIAATGGADQAILIPSIAGTTHAIDASLPRTYFTQYTAATIVWAKLAVGGGTHTIKLRLASVGGANAYFLGGTLIAAAFVAS